MLMRSRNAVRAAAVGVGAALLAALGCGQDGPKTYPVNGKVVFKGKGDVSKLAGYQVLFLSVGEPQVKGGGEVATDGTFTTSCYLEGKDRTGLPAGEYRVSISPGRGDDGESPRRGPSPLHLRYASLDQSGLKVTVTEGTNTPTLEVEGR